jgi:hypothetical protein
MGSSVQMIDSRYGHLARDSEATIRARLDARAARSGVGGRVTDRPHATKTATCRDFGAPRAGFEPATRGLEGRAAADDA